MWSAMKPITFRFLLPWPELEDLGRRPDFHKIEYMLMDQNKERYRYKNG